MQRNYIVFFVLSVLIMGGWIWLEQSRWRTPEKKAPKEPAAEVKKIPLTARQEAHALGAGPIAEQAGAGAFAAGPWTLAFAQLRQFVPPPARWGQIARELRPALFLVPPPGLPQVLALLPQVLPAQEKAVPLPTATSLGGEGFHLQVELTSLGAGVRSVTLSRFEAANYLGQPAGHKLELVPDDPIQPSYLLHHYPDPKAKNPVLGLGEILWDAKGKKTDADGVQQMSYTALVPGMPFLRITKTYRLAPTAYHLGLALEIKDERDQRGAEGISAFRYQLAGAHGLPIEGEWFTTIFRNAVTLMVDNRGGLWRELVDSGQIALHDGAPRVPGANRGDSFVQYAGVANQYFAGLIVVDDKQPERAAGGVDPKNILAWARATHESLESKGHILEIQGDMLDFQEIDTKTRSTRLRSFKLLPRARHHIVEELQLKKGDPAVLYFYETEWPHRERVATWARLGHAERPMFDDITNRVTSELIELKAGNKVVHQFLLYHGPVKTALLGTFRSDESVPAELVRRYTDTLHLNTLTDYASNRFSQTIFFTDIVVFFTRLMHWLLDWLQFFVRSYGISIILLTVLVRGAMFPISRRQAMFSVRMQELGPEMKKIAAKYKDDPMARQQATMELYRKHNIHPLGSCLPMLMQFPIFLGLYFALQESIHFRLAPFLWMPNLAAPDMLAWWTQHIPYISDPDSQGSFTYLGPFFNLLPVFAVGLMIVQQQLMMPPAADEQQEMQQKMMKFMSIFFGIMFYKMASGLCIYFIATSLWGLAERRLLPKKKPQLAGVPEPLTAPKVKPNQNGPRGRNRAPIKKEEETSLDKAKAWWAEILKQARKK
jgi:YidC/Oxa1 family membrane protein insertase